MRVSVVIPNFNSANMVRRCAQAMLAQRIDDGSTLEVVVVDDGSTDGSADIIASEFKGTVRLVRLAENRGRSSGRNAGAFSSNADIVVFVDCDCLPDDTNFVLAHATAIAAGADASLGQVRAPREGFWDALQRQAFLDRERLFLAGHTWAFTTQNVAVRMAAFAAIGGFDEVFDKHGFEDRDLFIRLARSEASATYTPQASVVHEDKLTLASVAGKFERAGEYCASPFRERHPEEYARMAFSSFDCALRPWLRVVDRLTWPIARISIKSNSRWLEWPMLPFRFRLLMARTIYAFAYMHGTRLAIASQPR